MTTTIKTIAKDHLLIEPEEIEGGKTIHKVHVRNVETALAAAYLAGMRDGISEGTDRLKAIIAKGGN